MQMSSNSDSDTPLSGDQLRAALEGRRPTINDVARLAQVSKKTVSRVINNSPAVKHDTRLEIVRVMQELGYTPDPQARGLAFRRAFLIGMIYDNPNPQYVVNMQQGLLDGMQGTGYELVVHPCDRSSPDFLRNVQAFAERQKLFGVVLTPSVSEDERVPPILESLGCEYVRIASIALDTPERMLVSHDHLGGEAAGRHLSELGHVRIAHVAGRQGFRSSEERRRGFEAGLAAHGQSLPDSYVIAGDYTFESGIRAGASLLALAERPTAIFAANDEMAAGVLHAAREAGLRVPEDLSVVGYDDFQLAERVWPRLTTISTPTRALGKLAAEKLILAGQDIQPVTDAEEVQAAPELVVRDSSGPVPV